MQSNTQVVPKRGTRWKIFLQQNLKIFFAMRTEIHLETKTKIEFVNESQARVLLPSGDAYIISFPSTFNYSSRYMSSATLETERQRWISSNWYWLRKRLTHSWKSTIILLLLKERKRLPLQTAWKSFGCVRNMMSLLYSAVMRIYHSK